MIAFN